MGPETRRNQDGVAGQDGEGGASAGAPPLALYIHWPFCVSKCPYCDFNSHVRANVDEAAWRIALLADLAHEARILPGRRLGSIFFGGGTPSLMPPALVADLIAAAQAHWPADGAVEITLEANPSSVESARFADLAAAGVNRLSLGLQALDDATLRFLGRAHDKAEGLAALSIAQRHFNRVSFDLITARPDQTMAGWLAELDQALAFGTEHLSLYQLTIEPGTRFAALAARGALPMLDPDRAADLFGATRAKMAAAGLPAYEVSNHARPGAQSRHNLAYWRYRDYAGIGPGAHGRRPGNPDPLPSGPSTGAPGRLVATRRHRKPETYLAAMTRHGHGLAEETELAPREQAREALVMGMRLGEGVDIAALALRTGLGIDALIDRRQLDLLSGHGLLRQADGRLIVTESGMAVLDSLLAAIVR